MDADGDSVAVAAIGERKPQFATNPVSSVEEFDAGKKTKAKHLAYIGDGVLADKVNVGAGTIFVNYDGKNKNKTSVGENAFIGSNSSLIAPLKIGKNSMIGAGSVVTADVPENKLALGRSRQKNIKRDW